MRRLILGLIALALLTLLGCGGQPQRSQQNNGTPPEQTPTQAQQPEAAARTALTASLPLLAKLEPGDEFDFVLSAKLASPLYQASGRVLYDSTAVAPVGAKRGALIPADDVFVARTDLAPGKLAGEGALGGVVPFAFTGLPGAQPIAAGQGELLRVRFKLLKSATTTPVKLLNTAEYLQLRDAEGARLAFDLAVEEVGK